MDRNGIPLAIVISGANIPDSKVLAGVVDAIPPVRNAKPGRPRFRPETLHADKGYDYHSCRESLKRRGIIPRIARKGIESSERLGRYRWVCERTGSWFNRFRRLVIRWEKRADIHLAFCTIAAALICFRQL